LAALFVIGFVLGMAICLLQLYGPKTRFIQWPIVAYEHVFRGIPIINILFIFYYGVLQFYDISAFGAAVLAMG
jgi:polar amino acid transport system permease protein